MPALMCSAQYGQPQYRRNPQPGDQVLEDAGVGRSTVGGLAAMREGDIPDPVSSRALDDFEMVEAANSPAPDNGVSFLDRNAQTVAPQEQRVESQHLQ
jgi:hypothetical protein